jgi:hypothetical protein
MTFGRAELPRTAVRVFFCILSGLFLLSLIISPFYLGPDDYFSPLSFLIMTVFLAGCAFRPMNGYRADPASGGETASDLGRWQFSLRRLLAAVTGVAVVFGCFGMLGATSSVVMFLSAAIVTSIFVRFVGTIVLGGSVIFACVYITIILRDLLERWFLFMQYKYSSGQGRGLSAPHDIYMFLIALCMLVPSALLLRIFYGLDAKRLLGALIVFEIFLILLVVSIAGDSVVAVLADAISFKFVGSYFIQQRWSIVVPWLIGTAIGQMLFVLHRRRAILENQE